MVEGWKDLWRSSGPMLLLKQGRLELVAQDHVQKAFECLQGWRLHSLCSVTLTVKRFFFLRGCARGKRMSTRSMIAVVYVIQAP